MYSILDNSAPPTCRVDDQDNDNNEQVNNINKIKEGVLSRSIPSVIMDSSATSNVRTTKDRERNPFIATGQKLDKAFRMPTGKEEEASDMDELHHDVRPPTSNVHIMPGTKRDSFLSIPKFVNANYILILDKDEANLYGTNKTTITVSHGAILQKWQCMQTNPWCVPLINKIKKTTRTQSSAINPPQDSYPTDYCQVRPSTTCMSSKRNPNSCDTTKQWQVSPPNHRG